jgi:hypothetical protein
MEPFNTPGETVTWPQRMSIGDDGTVANRVTDGHSTTWGRFGQGSGLLSVSFPTTLGSLSGYSSDDPTQNSAASWRGPGR